jgi:hypothetical protein
MATGLVSGPCSAILSRSEAWLPRRFVVPRLIVPLALFGAGASSAGACAAGEDVDRTGQEGFPCYPNSTCNNDLLCVSQVCIDPSELDAAGGSAGTIGSGGTTAGSSGSSGSSGAGGTSGTAGSSGSGAGGTSGSTGGSSGSSGGNGGDGGSGCAPPVWHDCNGTCEGNTPSSGCSKSTTCDPCPVPANATGTCTAGGDCSFNCNAGYSKQGDACVGGGGSGGSGGTGGSSGGTGGVAGCAGGPPEPTNVQGCMGCTCCDPWIVKWDASPGATYYNVIFKCSIFPEHVVNVGDVTQTDVCVTPVGMCNNGECVNNAGYVMVQACDATCCSSRVNVGQGAPLACGGGCCC